MIEKIWKLYDDNYKKLIVIPIIISIFMISALVFRFATTGEFFEQDITIKGGTAITFYTNQQYDLNNLKQISNNLFSTEDVVVRELRDISGNTIGYDIQVGKELNYSNVLEDLGNELGIVLDSENTSVSSQSALIASSFLVDSIGVIILAFFLMSLVIYYYFRSFIPAISIMGSTMLDVISVLGIFAIFNISFSIATIGAILMVIAYSTESDILLATNIIKRRDGTLMSRIRRAIKTELTMDVAAITTYSIMLVLSNVAIIQHIAFVLFVAIFFDVINTWILSAGLQRIYMERKK